MDQSYIKFLPRLIRTKIEGRIVLQKTIGNTVWLFADKIVRMGVGFIVTVWVARYLGPEQFGILNYSIAFVTLFSVISNLGLDGIVIRNIVRDPSSLDENLGSAFVLKMIGAIISLFLSLGAIYFLRPGDGLAHWLVGIVAVGTIFQAFDTIDLWFQSQIQSKFTVYAKSGAFLFIALIKVLLVIFNASVIAFAWAILVEVILGALGLFLTYKIRGYNLKSWYASSTKIKDLLHDSWPLALSGIFVMIYMKIDQVMLGEMIGEKTVGIYSAAVSLSESWYVVPILLAGATFPAIVEMKKVNSAVYMERMQQLYNLMTIISLAVAIPVTIFADEIIVKVYGTYYRDSVPVLVIHIWAGIFVALGVVSSRFLLAENYSIISFVRTFWGLVINVVLNLFLIPKYGAQGAALATLISYGIAVFFLIFPQKTRQQSIMMFKSFLLIPILYKRR